MKTSDIQNILFGLVLFLSFALSSAVSADSTKIAVPSTGQEKDSAISQETGRAPFFLLFDGNGHFLEALKNPAKDQYRGISRTVISLLVDSGVSIIVAGNVGDKMKRALDSHNIKYIKKTGVAGNAVQTIMQNH